MATKKSKEKNHSIAREPLDKEKIVQAALELLNEAGLQQLTIRRLAEALGIRSSSLYWHVRDKNELLQLLAENICSRIPMPGPNLSWQEQVLFFAREYRTTLLSIRDSADIMLATPPLTPKRLLLIEAMFKVFSFAGFPPKEVVMAATLVNDYMLTFVMNEMLISSMAKSQDIGEQEVIHNTANFFSNLPPDQYPNIIRFSSHMAYEKMDEHFEYSLQIILRGLEERLNNKNEMI